MIYANSVKLKFIYSIFKRKLNEIMSKEGTKKIVARAKELSSEYIRMFENGEEDNYKELIRNTELAEAREEAERRDIEKRFKGCNHKFN